MFQRHLILLVCLGASLGSWQAAFAQHRNRADLNNAVSESEVQAIIREIESRTAAARRNAGQTLQNQSAAVRDYGAQQSSLSASRDSLASQIDVMNTVTSFRNRDQLDQQLEQMREQWNAKYGPRIGVINPYEGTSYYRYYDENGHLMVTKVKGDYELLQRQREDWQTAYRRAQETRSAAEKAYADYAAQYGEYQAVQSEFATAKVEAEQRLSQFAADRAERERQRVAAEAERGESSSSNRYPRMVGGRLVSP